MRRFMLLATLATLALATPLAAQTRLAVRADSKLWIEGTSNVHDWDCKVPSYELVTEVDPAFAKAGVHPKSLRTTLRVPIAKISCGKEAMDKNLRKALNATDGSQIVWTLDRFETNGAKLTALGTMSLAGQTKPVSVDITPTRQADGSIKAIGQASMLMTDFGLKPVSIMMGAIKTGNAVTVKFDLVLVPTSTVAER